MNREWIVPTVIIICVTSIFLSLILWCMQTDRLYIENGYTKKVLHKVQDTMPQWVKD